MISIIEFDTKYLLVNLIFSHYNNLFNDCLCNIRRINKMKANLEFFFDEKSNNSFSAKPSRCVCHINYEDLINFTY